MLAKYHKIISAVIAIGTIVVVQAFASPDPVFRYLIPALFVFIFGAQVYNYFYLREVGKFNVWKLVQIGLFFVAWFGVFVLLPNYLARGLYLIASLPVIFFVEMLLANFGEQILINQTLLTSFGLLAASWGTQYYYRLSESYVFMLEFVAIALLARASFEFIPHPDRLKTVSALALGLFVLQIHWALSFLPLHYSALAVISFSTFYAMWTLYHYALFNVLTAKRIQFYLLFALAAIIVVLSATPWKVLN